MRAAVMLLLLLAAPAAQAQEAAAPAAQGPVRAEASPLRSSMPDIPGLEEERRSVRSTEAARNAEPSGRDFMYQILLTAVSALVTALVWKAVF